MEVFNDLIEHEAYALFLDVFAAYNKIQQSQACAIGKAFKTWLVLELPAEWVPIAQNSMVEAFRQVKVDQLIVKRPGTKVAGKEENPHDRVIDVCFRPIPSAASLCIQAMLQAENGPSELAVYGILEDCKLVTKAIADSKLESMDLGDTLGNDEMDALANRITAEIAAAAEEQGLEVDELEEEAGKALEAMDVQELESYGELLRGMVGCSTIKHLVLGRTELIHCHPALEKFQKAGGQLSSIKVLGVPISLEAIFAGESPTRYGPFSHFYLGSAHPNPKIHPMVLFMRTIAKFESLSEIKVDASVKGIAELALAFLDPLKGHAALNRLEIVGDTRKMYAPDNREVLACIAHLSLSCPSLRHFHWDCGMLDPVAWDVPTQRSRWEMSVVGMWEPLPPLEEMFQHPDFKLESITLIGARPSPASIQALASVLDTNKTLRFLSFKGGLFGLRQIFELLYRLGANSTLQQLVLPEDTGCIYLTGDDGNIHAFKPSDPVDREGGSWAFELDPERTSDADADSRALASQNLSEFAASTNMSQLLAAPQALLDHNRRLELSQYAYSEMKHDVAALMSSTPGASSNLFNDVAERVVNYLGDDRALRSVVRLSEVSKSIDIRKLHNPKAEGANALTAKTRALVKHDNREAVALNLTDSAPLEVNTVNVNGANKAIMDAVLATDPQGVIDAFKAGAIDFKGLGRLAAGQSEVLLAAFPPTVLPSALRQAQDSTQPPQG